MTTYIAHRINTIEELKKTPTEYGIEIDLRDYQNQLILQHDPFIKGELFEDFIKHFQHKTLILNIKSERIEYKVLEIIKKHNITDYFFLDSSFPMIIQLIKDREHRIATRFSEFETIDTILNLKDKIDWVWVDCFSKFPLTETIYKTLKKNNFKLCLVSPELQGREKDIVPYAEIIKDHNIVFDAICTKIYNIDKWESF